MILSNGTIVFIGPLTPEQEQKLKEAFERSELKHTLQRLDSEEATDE